MTRISGITISRCPHCGQHYQQPDYSSVNLMGAKVWSDGRHEYPLFASGSPIHRCGCGQWVLRASFVKAGALPSAPGAALQLPRLRDTEVPDEALADLIERRVWGDDVRLGRAMHLQCWQHMNRPYCAALLWRARAAVRAGTSLPRVPVFDQELYEPAATQLQIMRGLLEFTAAQMAQDWFCAMALHRELGNHGAARAVCQSWAPGADAATEHTAAVIDAMARHGISAPALLAYN